MRESLCVEKGECRERKAERETGEGEREREGGGAGGGLSRRGEQRARGAEWWSVTTNHLMFTIYNGNFP